MLTVRIHRLQYIFEIQRTDFLQFCLGFGFVAIFVPIPSISDIVPVYGSVIRYVVRPLFTIFFLLYNIIRKKKFSLVISRCFNLLCIICALMILTTIMGKQNLLSAVAFSITIIGVPLFFLSLDSRMPYSILKGICFYLIIITVINVATIFFFGKSGLYNTGGGRNFYFLGHVNSSAKIELPAIAILSTLNIYKSGRISKSTWIVALLVLISLYYSKSYVGAVGFSIFLLALFIFSIKGNLTRILPRWLPLAVSLLIFIGCCIMSMPVIQRFMIEVEQYFGREGSLNARTMMWAQGLNAVKNNILGYGRLIDYSDFIRLGNYYPSSAHNLYIDLAMQVGILGTALFIYGLFFAQHSMPDWNEWIIIPATLFSYAIMWNFEPYFAEPYFIILLIIIFVFLSMNFVTIERSNGNFPREEKLE